MIALEHGDVRFCLQLPPSILIDSLTSMIFPSKIWIHMVSSCLIHEINWNQRVFIRENKMAFSGENVKPHGISMFSMLKMLLYHRLTEAAPGRDRTGTAAGFTARWTVEVPAPAVALAAKAQCPMRTVFFWAYIYICVCVLMMMMMVVMMMMIRMFWWFLVPRNWWFCFNSACIQPFYMAALPVSILLFYISSSTYCLAHILRYYILLLQIPLKPPSSCVTHAKIPVFASKIYHFSGPNRSQNHGFSSWATLVFRSRSRSRRRKRRRSSSSSSSRQWVMSGR